MPSQESLQLNMNYGAVFSDCRLYRYKLWRIWNENKPYCMFLMLNPSTADIHNNDPTVERCQRYAADLGYGGLHVCNLFAYRATKRKDMIAYPEPVGPGNDQAILEVSKKAGIIVCAWGNDGQHLKRSDDIRQLFKYHKIDTHCLIITGAGEPGHPLYLKKNLKPELYLRG